MRFQKSLKNLLTSWIGQAAYMIVNLCARRVFINILGSDMLGIGGLFSNILSFLSFAELGIASAVCYSLYKPLAEQDEACLKRIMFFFKITYRVIGIFIFTAGTMMIPLLPHIVPEVKQYTDFAIYYELFVINTAASYFYVYKATLIEANQDRYMKIANHYIWVCLLGIMQIVGLLYFRNYLLYLVLQTIFTIGENISVSVMANRRFPFLKEKETRFPDRTVLKEILRNVAGTALNKIGTILVTGTDNILISRFSGLAVTGVFSNYAYVTTGLGQIFRQIYDSICAGIGDLNARDGAERVREIYREVLFGGHIFFSFGFVVMTCCLPDFICLWVGEESVLDFDVVILHLCCFYIAGMRTANITFMNALGLYWHGRYKGILEGVLNFGISIWLGSRMGITGVFLGTLFSALFLEFVVEPYILCRHGFKTGIMFTLVPFTQYHVRAIVSAFIIREICNRIADSLATVLGLLLKLIISVGLYALIVYVLWGRKTEFQKLMCRTKFVIDKSRKKRQTKT